MKISREAKIAALALVGGLIGYKIGANKDKTLPLSSVQMNRFALSGVGTAAGKLLGELLWRKKPTCQ